MANVKVGDVVVITDGSYAQSIINGRLESERLNCGFNKGRPYRIVAVDCSLPFEIHWQPRDYRNDVVIQDIESGKVVFIHHRFLAPTKHKIIIDGKTIELSRESFLNLKRQLAG